jgi:hypothetical protein
MRVKFLGRSISSKVEQRGDLLLCILSEACGSVVEVVDDIKKAELIIVYPYVVGGVYYRIRWVMSILFRRLFGVNADLRWLLGVGKKKILVVSHENLDRPYWWNMIGRFLVESNVPRLTFWPKEIDPKGVRFPYWYNYVDWPSYPRDNLYQRFGRLYQIHELMSPLKTDEHRAPYAVAIGSHYDHPRAALLDSVARKMRVDCFGGMGLSFTGPKLDLMRKYKYAFCPENSTGYGYDTEKLPEAWVAGCIPIGFYLNPYSEFNPALMNINVDDALVSRLPLLLTAPSLREIEEYVRAILQ